MSSTKKINLLCAEYGSPRQSYIACGIAKDEEDINHWMSYDGEGYDSHFVLELSAQLVDSLAETLARDTQRQKAAQEKGDLSD